MSIKHTINQLEATLIVDFDRQDDGLLTLILEDGRHIKDIQDPEEGWDLDDRLYWCDALRFSGRSEVVAEVELEDCL